VSGAADGDGAARRPAAVLLAGQIQAPADVPKRDGMFQSTYFHCTNLLNPLEGFALARAYAKGTL
jgi:hypothetical protein